MKKNLKVNTILNMIKTGSNIIFPLITIPYVLRILSADNIGKVDFGNSFVSYFSLIASLGISTYAIRECAKVRDDRKNLDRVASQIFSINICTTIIAYVLMAISLIVFRKLDSYRTLIIIQSTVILFTTVGADWINTAMEDFVYITLRSVLFQILSLGLMFLFVKTPDDYVKYALITVLSSSGSSISNIIYRKKYCKMRFTWDIPWKTHMIPILFLFVMSLSQTVFNSADITMLGLIKGNHAVGIYSTAAKIEKILNQLIASIVYVLMPRLSYMFDIEDYDNINILLRKVLAVFVTIGFPCCAGAAVMAKEIVLIVGGENYVGATLVLQILLLSTFFSLVGGSFLGNIVLLPSGNEKKFMVICCISTVINVIANAILIPIFGVYAAAATTAFSSLVILILLLFSVDKRIKIIKIPQLFIAPSIGSIIMVICCYYLKKLFVSLIIRTSVCIILGIIVYMCIQLILKNELLEEITGKTIKKFKKG